MKTPTKIFFALTVLLAILSSTAFAQLPKKQPLGRYQELWASSLFTTKLVPLKPAAGQEPNDAGRQNKERKDPAPQQGKAAPPKKQELLAWLQKFEPKPVTSPKALTTLDQLSNREAQRRGLAVKRRQILPDVKGGRYDRARLQFIVSGREQVLYQWLDRLQSPQDFRGLTTLRINPKRDDDTQVECRVGIEQWFRPEGRNAPAKLKAQDLGELRPLTESDHYPVELMLGVAQSAPKAELRLERAEITNTTDGKGTVWRSIRLHGTADELKAVNAFQENLKKSAGLRDYAWITPPAVETKTGKWGFVFDGEFSPEGEQR